MIGATQEQFINFTKDGWAKLMNDASPFGSKLAAVEGTIRTRAGQDYVEHRTKFFDMFDPRNNPVNLTGENPNWHTTYQGAFQMVPGFGRTLLDIVGLKQGTTWLPVTNVDQLLQKR
jgi:hypothetical protein